MSSNVLYLSPIKRKTVLIDFNVNQDINDLFEMISYKESIPKNEFKLYSNGKPLKTTEDLTNDSIIVLHFGLNGGKGGFGSMLRAIGAQIEKTTNREACRDLTGRRLRDINEEKRIKEWIKREKQRKEEMEEKRKQRLQRMAEKPKIEFNDTEFERNRSEIPDIVDEALQYGLQVQQRQQQSTSGTQVTNKRKGVHSLDKNVKKKKSSLWIGVEGIDVEDSDDSDEQTIEDNSEDQTTKDSFVSNESQETDDSKSGDKEPDVEQQSHSLPSNESLDQTIDKNPEKAENTLNSNQLFESISNEIIDEKPEKCETVLKETKQSLNESKPMSSTHSSSSTQQVFKPLNLMNFKTVEELESLGLDPLKHSLIALGLKCGGSLKERANRLWSIRGLDIKDIPKKLFAKK